MVATKDLDHDGAADSVNLFASMRDSGAEGTGIYFGQDPPHTVREHPARADKTLSEAPDAYADGTWVVTNR